MRVSDCAKCKYYERRTWSSSYKPSNYHQIGISHAYAYCRLFRMRCSNVKPSACKDNKILIDGGQFADMPALKEAT